MTEIVGIPKVPEAGLSATVPPIRVAWDTHLSSQNRGGSRTYADGLIHALSARRDVAIRRLRGPSWFDDAKSSAAKASRVSLGMVWEQTGLPLSARKAKADLVHSPMFVGPVVGNIPLVVTAFDVMYKHFPDEYPKWWHLYLDALMPRVIRRARAIITTSEHSRHDIAEVYKIPEGSIHVIYPGIDVARLETPADPSHHIVSTYGLTPPYVLYLGELAAHKNLDLLLQAVRLLIDEKQWPGLQVALAGSGTRNPATARKLTRAIYDARLQDVVVTTGYVAEEHLGALYTGASVFAFPSECEGFGFPVLEAMSCGVPVVALARSSVPEVLGNAGVLVEDNEPAAFAAGLLSVLGSCDLSRHLRHAGPVQAARFTWATAAANTAGVYRSVLAAE